MYMVHNKVLPVVMPMQPSIRVVLPALTVLIVINSVVSATFAAHHPIVGAILLVFFRFIPYLNVRCRYTTDITSQQDC